MPVDTLHQRLQQHSVAWPTAETLLRLKKLQARLDGLPVSISGISLAVLKDASLPSWKDGNVAKLIPHLPGADANGLLAALQAMPLPTPDFADEQLACTLSAARVLRGLADNERAVELLVASARAVRARPERTWLALWLLEVAAQWCDQATDRQRAAVWADLGRLLAQTGGGKEGTELLRASSELLFELAQQTQGREQLLASAWTAKYEADMLGLRTKAIQRGQAREGLRATCGRRGAREGSEAWFHASFELIFAEAGPDKQTALANLAQAVLEKLELASLSAADKERIKAHANDVLGHVLRFGKNRFLHTQACDRFEAAIAIYRVDCDWYNLAQTLDALGRARSQLGDHAKADPAFQESTEIKLQLKDLWGLGASLNGRADSLLRRGQPRAAMALYEANVRLIENAPAMLGLLLQNLGEQAIAWMAEFQNPFESAQRLPAPEELKTIDGILANYASLMDGQPHMEISNGYYLMLRAALARVKARLPKAADERLRLLQEGEETASQSIEEFQAANYRAALPNVEIHLAGLKVDRARLTTNVKQREAQLAEARAALLSVEHDVWDSYERAYLDLEWAWYYQAMGQTATAEDHLSSARHHAHACGNQSIEVRNSASSSAHLRGPATQDRWEMILPPGEQMQIPIYALDWRGRPLAGYQLQVYVAPRPGSEGVAVNLATPASVTDALGQATFAIAAAADSKFGTVSLEIRDHEVLRETTAMVHVQPFVIEMDDALAGKLELSADDYAVIRHLFGPRFGRVVIRRQFGGGLAGALVLLVESFLTAAAKPVRPGNPSLAGEGLRAQCSLIKVGKRRDIVAEAKCYDECVKDLLSPNVSRIAEWTVWKDRAGIRMSLAGDQEWPRARDEREWLLDADALEIHHLLVSMFARDLGTCWYSNAPVLVDSLRFYEAYGRQLPVLLSLRELRPGSALATTEPRDLPRTRITEGLRPSTVGAGLQPGNVVYLGKMSIMDWKRTDNGWEYELASAADGLRVLFRTQLAPRDIDADAMEEKLIGQEIHVVGTVEQLAFDRLLDTLRACVTALRADSTGEQVVLADDGTTLTLRMAGGELSWPNPLFHIHDFLDVTLPQQQSLVHGDLHTRNVIVSPRGMPYYIDFSEAGTGPTLLDFVKHEVSLWDWNLASPPPKAPMCSLAGSIRLIQELCDGNNRFPSPFSAPRCLRTSAASPENSYLAKLFQCVATLRSLAKQYSAAPDEAPDYFIPLSIYAGLMLRWCDPRKAEAPDDKAIQARRGVLLTALSGLLLKEGLT